jgi:CRISPR/Cas system-associated endoribonuclease Cas2
VTVDKLSFSSVASGNIIKVYFSEYYDGTYTYTEDNEEKEGTVTYWQYSLGQKANGWTALTGFSGGDLTKGQASASYTLTAENVTELSNYGLAVNGRFVTVTKVELLTVSGTETIWTGSVPTGNWGSQATAEEGKPQSMVALSYNDKGNLANAQMYDYIKMTYTVTASGAQAAIQKTSWESLVGKDDNSYVAEGDNTGKTITLTIDDATTLENIQQNGVLLRGKNITITSLELVKPDTRYDAVPLTIGTDGVATFGSSKHLDFTGISGVTPYYASNVEQGKVTLTAVTTTRGWAGYIVKGTAGTYNIPVTATEPTWNDAFSNLRYAGDYNGNKVYRSQYSDYSGDASEDEQTKIKTYYRYIFAKKESNIGFYKLGIDYSRTESETTVYYHLLGAHKAYLETATDFTPSGSSGARVALTFSDEEPDGISEKIVYERASSDASVYDLQGRRIATSQPTNLKRGLYIVNGKKVVLR